MPDLATNSVTSRKSPPAGLSDNSLAEPDDAYLDLLGTGTFGVIATQAFKPTEPGESSSPDNEFVSLFSDELSNNPYYAGKTGDNKEPNAYWVPRPELFIRLLLFASLGLLVVMTALAAIVSRQLQQRMNQVSAEVQTWTEDQPFLGNLPDPELIASAEAFAQALQDFPDQQGKLHRSQAAWLKHQRRFEEASEHYRLARMRAQKPATIEQWMQEIDCWMSQFELNKAQQQLGLLLQRNLSEEDQGLIQSRLSRIMLHHQRSLRDKLLDRPGPLENPGKPQQEKVDEQNG